MQVNLATTMEAPQQIPILLLKTKSTPDDSYEEYFTSSSFSPTFVPVLEHKANGANLEKVWSLVVNRELPNHYGGMIFTSQRAVEAFANVVEDIERSSQAVPLDSSIV